MGGGWRGKFNCKHTYVVNFFGGLLQIRNKIKWAIKIDKIIHSYLPYTVKKRKHDPRVLWHILIALYIGFFYFVTLFVVLWFIVILTIYLCHIFFKKNHPYACTRGGSRLNSYMHVHGGEGGGTKITKSEHTYFTDEPFVYRSHPDEICLCSSRLAKR